MSKSQAMTLLEAFKRGKTLTVFGLLDGVKRDCKVTK